ncbi:MAG: alpha/beta fold hydrolase [Chloroflexales bacterium]
MATAVSSTTDERRYSVTEKHLPGEPGPTRYWASEPRHGLPVLFIHGYAALIDHWRPIVRPVAQQHSVYALDLYGFGYSARPAGPATKARWVDQVVRVLREVIGGPAIIVGHSMGGVVATEVARRYPELTRGLVLVNSSGMQLYERPLTPTDDLMLNLVGAPLFGELLVGIFANQWGVHQGLLAAYHRKDRVTPELVATFSGPLQRYGGASYLAVTRASREMMITMEPDEYTGPTLLIWGEEDHSIPSSDADAIKRRCLPQAEIVLLPASGHCPFDETPEAFCATLLPWLARLPGQPATGG